MSDVVAEFYGGPRDGVAQALPELREQVCFATLPNVPIRAESAPLSIGTLAYDLIRDPNTGRPSVNDSGRYRYRFAGYREERKS